MSLIILTKSPEFKLLDRELYIRNLKKAVKRMFGIKRGPQGVINSLLRGLNELNYPYILNPKINEIKMGDVVYVNNSISALKWAIGAKKNKLIKKLVTGPNMVVFPDEQNGIMKDPNIDVIFQPSKWTKDLWSDIDKYYEKKVKIWPAGVRDPEEPTNNKREGCLIFKKEVDDVLYNNITNYLKSLNVDFETIVYGWFEQEKYFDLLQKKAFMIYLTASESQCLALHEAWMRDVPTLVWNRGYYENKKIGKKIMGKISAPYLTDECGMFFEDFSGFKTKFKEFCNNLEKYRPRKYSLENFTDKIVAQNFIKLIEA